MPPAVCEPDFIPPYLARSNKTVLGASISARKISEHRTRFTYAITWEEDTNTRTYSGRDAVAEEPVELLEFPVVPESLSDIMTLDQRTDGQWTLPRSSEMIWTRAIAFNKVANGNMLKKEVWSECESSIPVGDMVDELLERIPYARYLARIFLCPSAKGAAMTQLTGDSLQKPIKELDLHHGKLCLVIDYVNVF